MWFVVLIETPASPRFRVEQWDEVLKPRHADNAALRLELPEVDLERKADTRGMCDAPIAPTTHQINEGWGSAATYSLSEAAVSIDSI